MHKDWHTQRADEFCLSVRDGTHDSPKSISDGKILITSKHITGGRVDTATAYRISVEDFEAINRRSKVDQWDVLISMIGTVGEVCLVREKPDFAIKNIGLFKSKSELDGKWLYFFLLSPTAQQFIRERLRGTTQQYIPLGGLRELIVPIPKDRHQMTAIVWILDCLTNKIELNRKMNEALEAMARATFKSWFIDFDPVRAKMDGRWKKGQSLPGLPAELFDFFPADMENFEGRDIPKSWTPVRVDSILTLSYGKSLPSEKRVKGNVPVYGSGGINGFHNSALVQNPTIIVGRKGTVGSLFWEDRPNFPIDTVFFVESKLSLSYLFFLLESLPLKNMNTDAAVPGLNRENVYRLLVPNPGPNLIEKFSTLVNSFRCRIVQIQQETETLSKIKDSILPRLISGELQINDPDKFLQGVPL